MVYLFVIHSRAANSVVSSPIWPKLELIQNIMHAIVTCKLKRIDLISSVKRGDMYFMRSRTANSVVSGNSSKLLCMSLLPASRKRVLSETVKKTRRHRCPHYEYMEFFSDGQAQLNSPWSDLVEFRTRLSSYIVTCKYQRIRFQTADVCLFFY